MLIDDLAGLDQDELAKRLDQTRIFDLYPETGPLRRELYGKHMEFYRATKLHDEVAFVAANRSGKSLCACYNASCGLIGWYPPWWEGRTFSRAVVCWASGEDAKAVRESLQRHLLGPPEAIGTGLIPAHLIERAPSRGGIPDAIDFAQIRHPKGTSRLLFKAYEQGRESFQAGQVDIGICDEEPPMIVYTEFKTRTISTVPGEPNGLLTSTFTPLKGISDVVLMFLPGGKFPETEELRRQAWGW
jgi:phage terminase large subunit-like protein